MPARNALMPRLYISYSQFSVYDRNVAAPGCLWTAQNSLQGFARRASTVSFGTICEYGDASVTWELGPFVSSSLHELVIAVPFVVARCELIVDGPEERVKRLVELPIGDYRLVAAQRLIGEAEEAIDLFFEKVAEPVTQSEILVAVYQIDVPDVLLEDAAVA
jgi:Competence protein J (ComJ)